MAVLELLWVLDAPSCGGGSVAVLVAFGGSTGSVALDSRKLESVVHSRKREKSASARVLRVIGVVLAVYGCCGCCK